MAKQDLVVKLLLDSGAFGNDLRTAERKAQEFSNKMKSAGNSVGAFGNEIGLSAGALGKLGGMLTGAGAVVAAVGAFKSVMESSAGTAKQFGGIVEGCKSVVDNFQTAIATFDFSNFNEGLLTVIKNGKKYKEAIIDMQQGDIGYDFLKTDYSERLKALEVKYKDPKTTDAERKLIETERDELLRIWSEDAAGNLNLHLNAFLTSIKNKEKDINTDLLDLDTVMELISEASRDFNANRDEEIVKSWKKKSKEINKARREWKRVEGYRDAIIAGTQMGDIVSVNAETDELKAKYEKLKSDYQTLMIKATIFDKYKPEELQQLYTLLTSAKKQNEEVSAKTSEVMGWSAPSASTKKSGSNGKATGVSTGGSTGGSDIIIPNPLIEAELRKAIKQQEQLKTEAEQGSEAWWKATNAVAEYTKQLEKLLLNEAKLKHPMEPLPKLPNILPKGLTAPEIGIKNPYLSNTEENPVENIKKDYEGLNTVLSSTVFLFNSLGSAIEDTGDKSSQNAIAMMNIFSAIAEGALNVIPALQALTAAEGTAQAAKVPWPANIAAILSIVATVTSVFASIKNISGKFAEGGIVGGTSYSGDKLFAMVNSGEMILNKRQQGNLANMIGGGGQVEFHISGDSLVGVLNNKRNKTNLTR